jgi:hypothetical protein
MDSGLCSRNNKEMKNNGKTRYGGYRHGSWDDSASWCTITFIIIMFFANVFWSF